MAIELTLIVAAIATSVTTWRWHWHHSPPSSAMVSVVDVDADQALEARYDELVPVLLHGETELATTSWTRPNP